MLSFGVLIKMFAFFLDLESEMYQLSHLLIEQRNILSTLREQNATENTNDVLLDEPENGKRSNDIKSESIIPIADLISQSLLTKMKSKTKKQWQPFKNHWLDSLAI